MKQIEIKLTEQLLQAYTGYTVDELADLNGYQSVIANPAFSVVRDDVSGEPISNGEEQTIANPTTRTQHLAQIALVALVKAVAEPIRKQTIANAQEQATVGFGQALQMIIDNAEVTVLE